MFYLQALEDPDEAHRGERGIDLDMQRLPVEVIDDIKGPESAAVEQCVTHEVGRPDRVRQPRNIQRHPESLRQSALRSATVVEPHLAVHSVDPFVVPGLALPAQQLSALPEAAARPTIDQGRNDLGVPNRPVIRHPIPVRARQADTAATAGDR